MKYIYNDGGRAAAGFQGNKMHDCVARAIAITSGKPYAEVWHAMAKGNASQGYNYSADHCVKTSSKWFNDYMNDIGFIWTSKPAKTYLREENLPKRGRFIIETAGHYAAFIDGVLHDTYNSAGKGRKILRGFWFYKSVTGLYDVYKNGAKINRYALNERDARSMKSLHELNYGGVLELRPNDLC